MTDARPGYTLIMSVLLVSAVLILLATSTAWRLLGHHQSGHSLTAHLKAKGLAEGCMETALLHLREDPTYAGDETITIGSGSCAIRPIASGDPFLIQTEASVDGRVYNLEAEASLAGNPPTVTRWERIDVF